MQQLSLDRFKDRCYRSSHTRAIAYLKLIENCGCNHAEETSACVAPSRELKIGFLGRSLNFRPKKADSKDGEKLLMLLV
ncbi:hypothetical protein [Chamaesiphon polymorphus]|uniref:Uncharacterized protein n=1 Tax=Chamaesiphon polymorphus CCALA 037 TaxID=2107692 RepID=A0A2T1GLR5_9CYAN|nr:hypothetical protein [Chamaesiphon polymorphus]PSB58799.1 hypothetical protein C7B77_03380 [Chamaesiphon polymorphus CCALA 037]